LSNIREPLTELLHEYDNQNIKIDKILFAESASIFRVSLHLTLAAYFFFFFIA
ncbi:hypothetical protein BY458DRAFT_440624, partial [Sporodiniella umbellata]